MPELQLLTIETSQIRNHPDNPRRKVTDLAELTQSVKEKGILEPLIVAPWPEEYQSRSKSQGTYLLLAGHRRLAAAKKAGVESVPAILRDDLATVADQLSVMLIENLHRSDLSPVEEAQAYQALLDLDMTQADVAKRVGRSKRTVKDRVRLMRLPEQVREDLHSHQITLAEASTFNEFDGDSAAQDRLQEAIGTANWPWVVENERRRLAAAKQKQKVMREFEQRGITTLTEYPPLPPVDGGHEPEWACLDEFDTVPGLADEISKQLERDVVVDEAGCPFLEDVEEWHAAVCSAHAVVVAYNRGVAICRRIEHHRDLLPDEWFEGARGTSTHGSDAKAAAEAATARREQEVQERQEALDVAATVRRTWLGEALAGEHGDPQTVAHSLVRDQLLTRASRLFPSRAGDPGTMLNEQLAAGALFLQLSRDATREDVLQEIEDRCDREPLGKLVMLAALLDRMLEEPVMVDAQFAAWPHYTSGYARTLHDQFGYPWSDVELQMLPHGVLAEHERPSEAGAA